MHVPEAFNSSLIAPSKPNKDLSTAFSQKILFLENRNLLQFTWSSPRPISTRKLNTSLYLHIVPIYLVVFKGSYLLVQWDILS